MKTQRRTAIKKMFTTVVGITGVGLVAKANTAISEEKVVNNITNFKDTPVFSASTKLGNLVFISGQGAHVAPFEIKAHTQLTLQDLEKELIKAGSSMEKVLKVSVFLSDINDFAGMNEVYKGRFGKNPPVRTTVAVAKNGIPGKDAIVEIDCIAYI
jgi:2-iminobutanoate/2-iminopropanoate deaminase